MFTFVVYKIILN